LTVTGNERHGGSAVTDGIVVRAYADDDFAEIVRRWHETNLVSYRYNEEQQRHTLDDAQAFFRGQILTRCQVLVAEHAEVRLGVLALEAPWIRQFAVFPEFQRRGVGTALLRAARERSPAEVRLFTFQRNAPARAFYESHGFRPIAFGMSPPPELEPDVLYRWVA
jgi:ribosomal protein S18 acetylase RimI-like enzyme